MDLSFSRHIWRFALLVGMLFLALSCIMDKDFPMDEEWMGKEAVLFNVLAEPASKLSYEGVHTSFVNGESVGCIIAEKNGEGFTFGVSTKWTYQDGALKLESDDNEYVARHMEDGYVTLVKPEVDYAFFFYYPYSESVTESNWMSLERTVLTDFSGDEGTTVSRLSASDHLWTRHLHGVATTGMKTVNLTFKKKTATVEIHCDDGDEDDYEISDVWLDAVSGSAGVQTEMHMNLTSGTLTVSDTEKGHDGLIKPGLIHEEEGSIHESGYRMIFVPQTILSWRLHATITEGGNNKEYNIALEDKLRTLEEGKLYIFHVAKAGDGYILINDWNSDNTDNLIGEEVDVPTDLTMWAQPLHSPEKIDGAVVIKAGDNLIIQGKNFWKTDHCIVDKVQLEGARVFAKSQENPDGFELSDNLGDGYRTITFKLPDTAKDGPVYLVMPSGVMVSPGNIYTVKPVVTGLTPESVDMINEYVQGTSAITLTGTDLDLVEKVIFGGDYAVDADPSDDGTSLTALIPQFAQTGNIRLVLKNGLVIDSGKQFTVVNPQEEVKVTSVSGRFSAGETITVKGLHLSETGKIHLTGADSQTIVLDKTEDFKIDGDGTITFEFPAEARDGIMTFYKGSSLIWIPVQIDSQEAADNYPYETLMPSYLEVQKIDDKLYVYGKDLDVIGTVTLNSSTVGDAHIEGSEIYFNWDEELKGNIRLTSKNGKFVDLPYDFTPTAPIVTSISALQGNLTKTVVDANGQAQEVEDPLGIKVGAGDVVTLHGSYLNLATKVRVRDQEIGTFTVNGENTELTFTFASVSMNGYIYLVTSSGVEVNVGRYELAGSVSVSEVNGIFKSGNQVTLTGEYLGRITSIDVSDVDGTTNKVTLADGYDDVDFVVSDDGKSLTFNYPEAGQNNGTGKLVFYSGTVPVGEYLAEGLNVTEYGRYGNEIYLYGENLEGATVKLNDATLNPSYDSGNGRLVIDHSKSGNEAARTYEGTFVVSTKHGYSVEQAFDFSPVATCSPAELLPGETLTLTGSNLDLINGVIFYDGTEDENNTVYVRILPAPSDHSQITVTVPAGAINGPVKLRRVDNQLEECNNNITVNAFNGTETEIWSDYGNPVTEATIDLNTDVKAGDKLIVYTRGTDNYHYDWSFTLTDGSDSQLTAEIYANSTGVVITLTDAMITQIKNSNGLKVKGSGSIDLEKVSVVSVENAMGVSVNDVSGYFKTGNSVSVSGVGLDKITSVKISARDDSKSVTLTKAGYQVYYQDGVVLFNVPQEFNTGDAILTFYVDDVEVAKYVPALPSISQIDRDVNTIVVSGENLDQVTTGNYAFNYNASGYEGKITMNFAGMPTVGTVILTSKHGYEVSEVYDFKPVVDEEYLSGLGPVSLGGTFVINGENLDLVTYVFFTDSNQQINESVVDNSPSSSDNGTKLTIKVPSTGAVTGPIRLRCRDNNSNDVTTENSVKIEDVAPAQTAVTKITSIRDASEGTSVTAKAGETVTLTGTGLNAVTEVIVNTVSVTSFTSKSDSQISFEAPDVADGGISVVTSSGNINVGSYITPTPVVSDCVRVENNQVKITGTDLDLVSEVWLKIVDNQNEEKYSSDFNKNSELYLNGQTFNIWGTIRVVSKYSKSSVAKDYSFRPRIEQIKDSESNNTITEAKPGQNIRIEGDNLDLVNQVIFKNSTTGSTYPVPVTPTLGDLSASLTVNVPENTVGCDMIFLQDITGGSDHGEYEFSIVETPVVDPDPGTGDGEEIVLKESVEGLPEVTIDDVSSLKAGCKLVINYTWPEPDNNNWGGTLYVEAGDKTWGQNEKVISSASFDSTSKHSFVITSDMLTKIMNNQSKITIWKNAYDGIKITKVSVIKSVSE